MKQSEYTALYLLGGLDDGILDLAEGTRGASHRSKPRLTARTLILKRLLPIAACFALILSSVLVIGGINNSPKPFDPHDHTTWGDQSNVITIEQCESVYLYDTFEEIVEKIGRPYYNTWHPCYATDCEKDCQYYYQIARWIVEDRGYLEILFLAKRTNGEPIESAPCYYPRQSLQIDLENLYYNERYDELRYQRHWLKHKEQLKYSVLDPYLLIPRPVTCLTSEDPELYEIYTTFYDTAINDADLWVSVSVGVLAHPYENYAEYLKRDEAERESRYYAEKESRYYSENQPFEPSLDYEYKEETETTD